jgi:Cu+-exporting ATPase
VNFGAEQASVRYDPQITDIAMIQAAIDQAGYSAQPLQTVGEPGQKTSL